MNKIIYCSPYYDPSVPSGANRRFDEICHRLLSDFGSDFTLIVSKGKIPPWWKGPNLIEVNYGFNHRSKFSTVRQIATILNTLPPSIVINESIPIPFRALRRHRHFQAAYDFRYFHSFSKSFIYRLIFSQYLKYEWRNCENIITCSEFSIDELEKHVGFPRERVVKSFFGINEKIFSVPHKSTAEKKYDLIYVGHFDRHKNHGPLIEALGKLDKKLKAIFIGVDNGLKASLQQQANQLGLFNIEFKTIKNEEAVWEYYTQSRMFISPSLYEGFGMPTIEALALGLPVALSDIRVFHEVGGELALYFNPKDPFDIAQKISGILANPIPPNPDKVREHLQPYLWKNIYRQLIDDIF